MRRVAPWVLSVPLMVGGAEFAHWLSYRLVYPNAFQRATVLAQTGHSYFAYAPVAVAAGGALVIVAVAWHSLVFRQGVPPVGSPPSWQFLLLPALCFALQEHLEQLFATGGMSGVSLAPTFMLGILLTLPFGFVAFLVARLLLHVAEHLAEVFGRPFRSRLVGEPACSRSGGLVLSARSAGFWACCLGRGPPFGSFGAAPAC